MPIKNKPTENHVKEVSRILRDFNQPDEWKDSYWLSSYLVKDYLKSGKSQTPYQAIRAVFSDILNLLVDESPYYGDILRGRYWEGQHVSQMVKNGRPQYWEERTFYTYQKKAVERFTSLLLEREQICQESIENNDVKHTEFSYKNGINSFGILILVFIVLASFFMISQVGLYLNPQKSSNEVMFSSNTFLIPTSTNGKIAFQENFEDGTADGFKNKLGLWVVLSETNGNKVLDIDSMDAPREYPTIEFGEADWKNFILESRVNIIDYKDSPLASIRFRGKYMLTFAPYWNGIGLAFDPPWKEITNRTIEIQKKMWYPIRMEVVDSKIDVFLANKLIISEEISSEISGLFGFGTWPEAHVQFDDVIIVLIE